LFTGFECTDAFLVFHENVDLAHVEERQVEGVVDETVNLLFQGGRLVRIVAGHFQMCLFLARISSTRVDACPFM
jgi:hypothetical protein